MEFTQFKTHHFGRVRSTKAPYAAHSALDVLIENESIEVHFKERAAPGGTPQLRLLEVDAEAARALAHTLLSAADEADRRHAIWAAEGEEWKRQQTAEAEAKAKAVAPTAAA